MKKIYILLFFLFIPFISYSQDKKDNKEDLTITINIGKVNNTIGNIIRFFKSEVNEYKNDINECIPEEKKQEYKQEYKEVKEIIKNGFMDCVKEMHVSFRAILNNTYNSDTSTNTN